MDEAKIIRTALGRTKDRIEAFALKQTDSVIFTSAVQIIGCLEVLVEELERAESEQAGG